MQFVMQLKKHNSKTPPKAGRYAPRSQRSRLRLKAPPLPLRLPDDRPGVDGTVWKRGFHSSLMLVHS